MSTTKDIDHDSIDKIIHTYDMCMENFLEVFKFFMMKFNHLESFFEIFGIYSVMMFRFFLFFEESKYTTKMLSIFFEE